MPEALRIKEVYEKRKIEGKDRLYSYFDKSSLFIAHRREEVFLELLKNNSLEELSDKKILDIGCGTGGMLRRLIDFGARPENLYGIDLLEERIETSRKLNSHINLQFADAQKLPYSDNFFDLVMQFTVFTSILDDRVKENISREMLRVLTADGIIIWYDYFLNNPSNPDVKGVRKKEIIRLFPVCNFEFRKVTLAPPLARALAKTSRLWCYVLEKIPFLRTHYFVVIKKK